MKEPRSAAEDSELLEWGRGATAKANGQRERALCPQRAESASVGRHFRQADLHLQQFTYSTKDEAVQRGLPHHLPLVVTKASPRISQVIPTAEEGGTVLASLHTGTKKASLRKDK